MVGKIDWSAIPILVELYGIEDVETFLAQLEAIKEHKRLISEV